MRKPLELHEASEVPVVKVRKVTRLRKSIAECWEIGVSCDSLNEIQTKANEFCANTVSAELSRVKDAASYLNLVQEFGRALTMR